MIRTVPTTCRLCESACGLLATLDGNDVVGLKPDRDHPVSKGYACVKGLRFHEVHAARPHQGFWRGEDRQWMAPTEVLRRSGAALRRIVDEHGPESVGLFAGNASGHAFSSVLAQTQWLAAVGTTKHYSSLTLDNSEMFVVAEAVFGHPLYTFLADYENSDFIVLVGTDPLWSQASQSQSAPGAVRALLKKAELGALHVVDPRRSATAAKARTHLAPKPGSDVAILAFLLREVLSRRNINDPLLGESDLAELRAAVARFDLATAAQAGDVEEAQLQALADGLLAAERPLVWSGLGVLLSADGTVGWWLTVALQAALGLERPGSWRLQAGAVDLLKASGPLGPLGLRGLDPSKRSRIGGYGAVMGTLAAATLADDILAEGPGQLRGLVVVGGNPALSLPDQPKVERALAHLEHLLVVDLRESDTAGFAHGFVPVKSWLSRDDIPVHTANQRSLPHLGASRALVADHRPDDWQAFAALSRAMGRPLFGSRAADALERVTGFGPREIALGAVALSAPRLLGPLRREGSAMSPPRASLRERGTAFADRRLRLAHPPFIEALRAWAPRARALSLVTSVRPTASLNTWLHQETGAKAPFATVHPEELGQRGLSAGVLTLSRPDGVSLRVEVRGDPTLRRGVVVLPFGWGHRDGRSDPGPAANRLVDTVLLEPFTGQPVSNGLTVVLSP